MLNAEKSENESVDAVQAAEARSAWLSSVVDEGLAVPADTVIQVCNGPTRNTRARARARTHTRTHTHRCGKAGRTSGASLMAGTK